MGFSIGSLLKTIAGPIIGGLIGGPFGPLIGGGITAGFAPQRRRIPLPTRFPSAGFPPILPTAQAGVLLGPIGRQIGGTVLGVIAGILATSRNNTGRPATAKKIREAARICGIETAASTFGISIDDVCTIIVSRRRGRGRGISAADLRRTRSTIRKITTMQHSLAHFVGHQRKRGAHGKFV